MFDEQDKQDQSVATTSDDSTTASTSSFPSLTDTSAASDSSSTSTPASTDAPVLPSFDTTPPADTSTAGSDNSASHSLAEPAVSSDSSADSTSMSLASDSVNEPADPAGDGGNHDKAEESPFDAAPVSSAAEDDLSGMKQEALDELHPLFEHLELSPEEEFKTTMMMIQANDDKTMLKKAFEAAKKISDDKARSHALLDVINEINYFTQKAA